MPGAATPSSRRRDRGRAWLAVLLALYAWPPADATPVSGPTTRQAGGAYLRVVEQDAGGITLELRIPDSAVTIEPTDDGLRQVRIDGLQTTADPGRPELPLVIGAFGVPESARLRISRLEGAEIATPGVPLRPAARLDAAHGRHTWPADPEADAAQAVWPERRVVVEEATIRGLRLARLLVYPVRYDPSSEALLLTRALEIRIDFLGGRGFRRAGDTPDRLAERVIRDHLLNRESVLAARRVQPPSEPPSTVARTGLRAAANPAVKIRVDREGLIRVTQEQLRSIGFDPAPVDPRNLEVSYRGTAIPCRVSGETDGSFDPGDAVEFFGWPASGRFLSENTFWLEEREAPGLRHATRDASPGTAPLAPAFQHTEHYEDGNTVYTLGRPAQEGDPHFYWVWFESNPNPPRVTTFTHGATLPGLTTGTDAVFRALFFGRTDAQADPDHHVRFRVNGTIVGESTWNGRTFHLAEIPFDPALLHGGTNSFRIDFVAIDASDTYFMDWIEIDYPRGTQAVDDRLTLTSPEDSHRFEITGFDSGDDPAVLDVSDPLAPVRLGGAGVSGSPPHTISFEDSAGGEIRYHVATNTGRVSPVGLALDVPSDLRNPANGADLIIVTPQAWEASLGDLVAHREAQGLRVVLANLTDVADEFAGGNVDDVAIRDFVAWAYHRWQGPPVSHVLLVGEPNLDARNWLGTSPFHHYMPTHFTVTAAQGETPSDTWFGAVDGDDELPDVAVGRFSVRDAGAASALAAKIIDYENNPPEGLTWGRRAVHVASSAIAFEDSLEGAAQYLPSGFGVETEYRLSGATGTSIRNAINAGALIVSFVGHGNVPYWADSPGGPFFTTSDAAALTNAGRLPLVTALNCLNGLVADPFTPNSLAEVFHNDPDTGALAVWSPSALGFLSQYDALQKVLYRSIFEDRVARVGSAATESLVEAWLTASVSIDLVREMILLADPSGTLALPCGEGGSDAVCNGYDDDCDGDVDEDYEPRTTSCGFGACAATGATVCHAGVVQESCEPGQPSDELCHNGVDDDCDGDTDEGDAVDATVWFRDADGDGFGDATIALTACSAPPGFVALAGDCHDGDPGAWATPGELEELRFDSAQAMSWEPPAAPGGLDSVFIIRSRDAADFSGDAVCLASDTDQTGTDVEKPRRGGIFHYLVRAQNGCPDGVGSPGDDSEGVERLARTCP